MSGSNFDDRLCVLLRNAANAYCGQSRSTEVRLVKLGLWPPAIALSVYTRAWYRFELDAMNAARTRGASEDQLRTLVKQIVAARALAGEPDWPPTFTLPEPRKAAVPVKRPRGRPKKLTALSRD